MNTSGLHHVEICVGDENVALNLLIRGFGFKLIGRQTTPLSLKWVVTHGSAVFVIVKRRKNKNEGKTKAQQHPPPVEYHDNSHKAVSPVDEEVSKIPSNDVEHWTVFCCRNQTCHDIDSAFNVALVVRDVDKMTQRVKAQGGQVLREPTLVKDNYGHVKYSIVTSCLGNVVHTLIDTQHYNGEFLPGFERLHFRNDEFKRMDELSVNASDVTPCVDEDIALDEILKQASKNYVNFWCNSELNSQMFTHFDHIAYVCETGRSKELIEWYEGCFGATRFICNRDESEEEGFVLCDDIGLRIKAMEYWKCAEVGLAVHSPSDEKFSLKLVIAESLTGFENNQVNNFLHAHRGPGVQHIALHTPNITSSVKYVSQRGASFRKAPPTYYQKGIRLEDIKAAGYGDEVILFQELGILLDTEDDVFSDMENNQRKKRYLMQVFTNGIFEENTLFLEVIQRQGATGFGGGNIKALAESVKLSQQQRDSNKSSHTAPRPHIEA